MNATQHGRMEMGTIIEETEEQWAARMEERRARQLAENLARPTRIDCQTRAYNYSMDTRIVAAAAACGGTHDGGSTYSVPAGISAAPLSDTMEMIRATERAESEARSARGRARSASNRETANGEMRGNDDN